MERLKFSLKQLQRMPTISTGQTDDLKVENDNTRIWLSRMTIEDGMPYNNQVTIEKLQLPKKYTDRLGREYVSDQTKPKIWVIVRQYEAK